MSSWFQWFFDFLEFVGIFEKKKGKILLLGLDNAGKTTLLGRLSQGCVQPHRPTYNPNVEHLQLGGMAFTMVDMGGHPDARRLWREYMTDVSGVVFLVDAADRDRASEAKEELDGLLQAEDIQHVPFLVLGNKIDLPTAVSEDQFKTQLGLHGSTTGKASQKTKGVRPVEVFMCSVVRNCGYSDGFRWLANYL